MLCFYSETNLCPSIVITPDPLDNSARQLMSEQQIRSMPTNGLSLDVMQSMQGISRHDSLDRLGLATAELANHFANFSRSGLRGYLIDYAQRISKKK